MPEVTADPPDRAVPGTVAVSAGVAAGTDLGPDVLFGPSILAQLPDRLRRLASSASGALLVCDPGVVAAGLAERVTAVLSSAGLRVRVFSAFAGDPTAEQIDAAAGAAADMGHGAVIGLGGGSALDVAKLAAVIAEEAAEARAFALGARELPRRARPLIAVPTTAGTGAEVTRTVVFSDARGHKLWAWGEALRPDLVLLDPTLTVSLPPHLTAATGLDALVHAIEAATNRRSGVDSRRWALPAIGLVSRHLADAARDGGDLAARGGLLVAACMAGRAIDCAGTGVAHAFGHALGTLGHVHHGRAVALSLAATLAGNAEAAPAAHAAVAQAMGIGGTDRDRAVGLAPGFEDLLRQVGLPCALDDHGLGPDDADRLVEELMSPANRPMLEANCRSYDGAECRAIALRILGAA